MTALATRPAQTTAHHAKLLDNGLWAAIIALWEAGVAYEVEPHQGDLVVAVYQPDDSVFVVIGYGVDEYDVARYDRAEWDDVYGEPTRNVNGVDRDAVVAILTY